MKLTINGAVREVAGSMSLQVLLQHLGIRQELVAVQRNEEIIARERLNDIAVTEGDRLEIVHMVGGG